MKISHSGIVVKIQKDRIVARPARRPVFATPEQKELICKVWRENDSPCAVILEKILDSRYARHIPHNRIHAILKQMSLASDESSV